MKIWKQIYYQQKLYSLFHILCIFQEEPAPSRCIGVFGLSLYTTERDLRPIFEKYGPVEDINIVYDHQVKWKVMRLTVLN